MSPAQCVVWRGLRQTPRMPCDQSRVGKRARSDLTVLILALLNHTIIYYCLYVCVTRTETNASVCCHTNYSSFLFCVAFRGRTAPHQFAAYYFRATRTTLRQRTRSSSSTLCIVPP